MYKTQMEAARKGVITDKMRDVLKGESVSEEFLLAGMASGEIIIPANVNHKNLVGIGVGKGLKTKVNVNLGVTGDNSDYTSELKKAELSLNLKADSIMDLSLGSNTGGFRKELIRRFPIMIGTVPVYDAGFAAGEKVTDLTSEHLFEAVMRHAEDGVDFITVHAGITKTVAERVAQTPRLLNIVSRGGSFMYEWIKRTGNENPFYAEFDRLLDICRKYDVTLSLGDGLRPGAIKDATDPSQIQELIILGELTRRAWRADVQVMIEGPGHVPLNEVEANIQLQKKLCSNAPFYVLGPLVTDIAPGYDHITSAIGGAVAAGAGADFLCYVTPAEHLKLPDIDDLREGLIASRIAAHSGDITKGVKGAIEKDYAMADARREFDWERMVSLSMDPEKAERFRKIGEIDGKEGCTMCGSMCAVKRCNDI